MPGLWRNTEETREGKYLAVRRDGTIPDCPYFVLLAADEAAPAAIHAYATASEGLDRDHQYVRDLIELAMEFRAWRKSESGHTGDPDAPPHREDNPMVIEAMRTGVLPLGNAGAGGSVSFGERDQPLLGLATTRQLLEELECRLRIGGNGAPAKRVQTLLDALDEATLTYRTVDRT